MFSQNPFYNTFFAGQDCPGEACIGGKRLLIRGASRTGKSSLVFNFARSMVTLGEVPVIIRHVSDFPRSSDEQRKKPHFMYVSKNDDPSQNMCTEINESTEISDESPSKLQQSIWSAYYYSLSLEEPRNPQFSLDAMHMVRVFYVDNVSDLIEVLISLKNVSNTGGNEPSGTVGESDRSPTILIIEDLSRILDSNTGHPHQAVDKLNRLSLVSNYIEYAIESIAADRRRQTSLSIRDVLHKNIANEPDKESGDGKKKRRRRSNSSSSNEDNDVLSSSCSSNSISRNIFNKFVSPKLLLSIANNEEASGVYWPMMMVTDSHQDSRYVDMLMKRLKCSTEAVLTKDTDRVKNSSYASNFHFPQYDSVEGDDDLKSVKMDVYYRKAYVRRNQQPFMPVYDASLPIGPDVFTNKRKKGMDSLDRCSEERDSEGSERPKSESKRDLRNHCVKTGSFGISMQQSTDVDVGAYLVIGSDTTNDPSTKS